MDDREQQGVGGSANANEQGDKSQRPVRENKGKGKYIFGVFYYNPEDPALMVPMKFGNGIDFNYARWPAKLFILLLMVGILIIVLELVL